MEVEYCGLVNKPKKKSLLGSVGRPNPAYSSSLEKDKIGKKPKRIEDPSSEDPFGLDPLLGLGPERDENVLDHSGDDNLTDLDLNSHPNLVTEDVSTEDGAGYNSDVFVTPAQVGELEATIALGGKLGANLSNSHALILDLIAKEGLQDGKL